jgi:DNA-binding phage protein
VKRKITFTRFEVSDYLDNEVAIAEYLTRAEKDENPDVLQKVRADVAKASLIKIKKHRQQLPL